MKDINHSVWLRKIWLIALLCVGISIGGCQCVVIVPPVDFQEPSKPTTRRDQPPVRGPVEECDVAVSRSEVEFPITPAGHERKQVISILNTGGRRCFISSLRFIGKVPHNTKVFSLGKEVFFPYLLMERRSLELEILFKPTKQGTTYKGLLLIDSNSPLHPRLNVELSGISDTPCVEFSPQLLMLGDTQKACSSRSLPVVVSLAKKKHCPASILVQSAKLTSNTSDEFSVRPEAAIPYKLEAGKDFKIFVRYGAKDLGLDQGVLEVVTSQAQEPVRIAVEGRGVPDASQTDSFVQKGRAIVDILFVVDSSCSMAGEQASMANNFNSFIRWAIRLRSDYRIGVTTTDVTGRRFPAGCVQGGPTKIITPQTPNPVVAFSQNVRVGTTGSASEKGLEAAYQALQPKALTSCNVGLYRKNALLSLIFVSDEHDQSPSTPAFYINFFRSLKGDQADTLLRASAVVGPERSGCRTSNGSAAPGPKYLRVARSLGGVSASICSPNWSNTLSQIGAASFARQSRFKLTRTALSSSIVVHVNGKRIQRHPTNGWSFDVASNSVVFAKTATIDVGSVIKIDYQVSCQP